MDHSINIPLDKNLCGTWVNKTDDTYDYTGSEYTVSIENDAFHITGVDRSDKEEFEISDIMWNGIFLTFHAYMPSTARCSLNQIRYVGDGKVEFLFTFIEREIWTRKSTA